MSSLMHPVGPEPERTYWVRRAIVVVACLATLAVLAWILSSFLGSRGTTVTSTPTPNATSLLGSVATPTPTPSVTSTTSASSTSTTPATPASSATSSGSRASSAASTPASPTTPSAPSSTPRPPCAASGLTLKTGGTRSVKSGSPTTLTVAITNTTSTLCTLNFKQTPITITVYSGSDRIWSTEDCAQWAPQSTTQELPAGRTWVFGTNWPTLRSASGCQLKSTYLQPGTYVATATVSGQNPSQFVMTLHG